MKAFAVYALALLGLLAAPAAFSGDAGSLKLDLRRAQDLSVEAHGVPVEQLLKQLGDRLNFTVDFSPTASRSTTVSGRFEGNIDRVLADILRGTNYVARYDPHGLSHVVVMAASGGPTATAPSPSAVTAPPADQPAPVANSDREAQARPTPPSDQAGGAPSGVVSKMLLARIGPMLPTDPNAPPPPTASGGQPLAVMTHIAQANVQALAAALRNVCIGTKCRQ